MAIDIKNILQLVQTKIAAVDANTSTEDIGYLLNLAKRVDGSMVRSYDSDGLLPDAASTTERLAYITSTGIMRFNNGQWDTPDEPVPVYEAGPANPGGGTTSGYQAGGTLVWATPTAQITKVPFATDIPSQGNETLHTGVRDGYGAQDRTALNGYVLGGQAPMTGSGQKWPFAAGGTGTIAFTGQTFVKGDHGGSWSSETDAYLAVYYGNDASVAKMPFASDTTMSDTGYDMAVSAFDDGATAVSETHGYLAGGVVVPYAVVNTIQKYAFTNTTNGVDVGDLTQTLNGQGGGHSSSTHGFSAGGTTGPTIVSTIQSWPFASDGNAVSVGTLSAVRHRHANWSSNDHGYVAGGWITPSTTVSQTHEKYAFNTGTPAALTSFAAAVYGPGIQY